MSKPPSPPGYGQPDRPSRQSTYDVLIRVAIAAVVGFAIIALSQLFATRIPPRHEQEEYECRANLHGIGLDVLIYCQSNDDHFPPTLFDTLTGHPWIGTEQFVCPASTATPATLPTTTWRTSADYAAACTAPGHLSYNYCGRAEWVAGAIPADTVLIWEPIKNHGDGAHFLLADGTFPFIEPRRAARLIAAVSATTQPVSAATVP